MVKIYFTGITNIGCVVQNAIVFVPEEYTMNQINKAIKESGYIMFMLPSMKVFAEVV